MLKIKMTDHYPKLARLARQCSRRKWAVIATFEVRASSYIIDQGVIGPWEIDTINWPSLFEELIIG